MNDAPSTERLFNSLGHLICIYCTSCFIVGLLPVENDERRASLDGDHRQVGGGNARRAGHILITAILVGEVSEGGGDGARLVVLFIRLIDHMRSCGEGRTSIHVRLLTPCLLIITLKHVSWCPWWSLTYKALLAHDVDLRCRQGPENGGVFI